LGPSRSGPGVRVRGCSAWYLRSCCFDRAALVVAAAILRFGGMRSRPAQLPAPPTPRFPPPLLRPPTGSYRYCCPALPGGSIATCVPACPSPPPRFHNKTDGSAEAFPSPAGLRRSGRPSRRPLPAAVTAEVSGPSHYSSSPRKRRSSASSPMAARGSRKRRRG